MSENVTRKRSTYHVGNLGPQLLEEARRMLAEVGPSKLSIRAVSDRIGVSATATYHHFSSKNTLLCHLAEQGFRELHHSLRQRPATAESQDLLRIGCLAYFTFAINNPQLYQLMFGPNINDSDMPPECQEAREGAFCELKQIISEVLKQPIDSKEVFSSALASWSFTHGLASLVIHKVLHFTPENPEVLVTRAMRGLKNIFEQ